MSLNLARPLALLIEVKDAETGASDARLVERAPPLYPDAKYAKNQTDIPCREASKSGLRWPGANNGIWADAMADGQADRKICRVRPQDGRRSN